MLGDSFARQQPNCQIVFEGVSSRNHEIAEAGLAESIMGGLFVNPGYLLRRSRVKFNNEDAQAISS